MGSDSQLWLRIVFRKGEGARFLSHLDLMATFEYAVRRARLPVELSRGFNPRPRMSAAAPLALGHVGEEEILEIELREMVPAETVHQRLQAAAPPGITVLSVQEMPPGQKRSASRLRSASYCVGLPDPVPDLQSRVDGLLSQTSITVEELRKGGVRRRDLRPFILSLRAVNPRELQMDVRLDGEGSVRPEQILEALSLSGDGARITRERIELKPF